MQRFCRSSGVLAAATALFAACATSPLPRRTSVPALALAQRVDHVDLVAREPMLVELPDGSLFVAGYGSPHPTLWKSTDGAATWHRVHVGGEDTGAAGNSDVDLAAAPDGTLYFATMLYDRTVFEGRGISIGVSTDGGVTWRWSALSRARFDDRPWVEVAPDGTAHVIWNDGSGIKHRASRDRGRTWTDMGAVHDKGGSSHLAIGPRGEVAVRVTPASASFNRFDAGVDLIAVSTDGGRTWRKHAVPGERDWAPTYDAKGFTPRWVEPIAWDALGRLYALWTDKAGVQLARSVDQGDTWTTWLVSKSKPQLFFPYLVARRDGELAATWFSAAEPTFEDLQAHVARIHFASPGGPPQITFASPWSLESARPPAGGQGDTVANDTGGEYLGVALLSDGDIAVVGPIQNKAAQRMGFSWWRFR